MVLSSGHSKAKDKGQGTRDKDKTKQSKARSWQEKKQPRALLLGCAKQVTIKPKTEENRKQH
jgi:hypothetical protein